ncbi:MAG TPA: DoxX family protein [Haliangiales bacterium]|nr:DoxX family protein [Haliangiales bacterium]
MTARAKTIGYWTTTALLVLGVVSGGAAELARSPGTIEGIVGLGYPAYLATILGVWKLLGTVALLAPRFPRLKEWAYAGIFFNMTGAAISHAVCGDAAWHVLVTLGLAGLAVASWALRPPTRTLGALLPAQS